jgi:hypothetical protein
MLKYYKPFVSKMESLARRHSVERVFSDFLVLATCAYHPKTLATPGIDPDPDNEAEYLGVSKGYTRDELNGMAELMALLRLQAAEQPFSDLLGEFFCEHVTRGRNGQFFTPENICKLMARMTVMEETEGQRIADPACGSGRMLLAVAEDSPHNLFFAADVDHQCARMTALNFLHNGLSGEVVCMNTLTLEAWRAWHINAGAAGIKPIPVEMAYQVPGPHVHQAAARARAAAPREEPAFVPRVPALAPPTAATSQLSFF